MAKLSGGVELVINLNDGVLVERDTVVLGKVVISLHIIITINIMIGS